MLLFLLLGTGCSGGRSMPETAAVAGVVRVNGRPLPGLMVRFLPDPAQGNDTAFSAAGITDEQGRYVLKYEFDGHHGEGSAVGWHRVLVTDAMQTYSDRDQHPKPPRVPYTYASPATTPLSEEVQPGENTIDLDVKR